MVLGVKTLQLKKDKPAGLSFAERIISRYGFVRRDIWRRLPLVFREDLTFTPEKPLPASQFLFNISLMQAQMKENPVVFSGRFLLSRVEQLIKNYAKYDYSRRDLIVRQKGGAGRQAPFINNNFLDRTYNDLRSYYLSQEMASDNNIFLDRHINLHPKNVFVKNNYTDYEKAGRISGSLWPGLIGRILNRVAETYRVYSGRTLKTTEPVLAGGAIVPGNLLKQIFYGTVQANTAVAESRPIYSGYGYGDSPRVFKESAYPVNEAITPAGLLIRVMNNVARLYRAGDTVIKRTSGRYAAEGTGVHPEYGYGGGLLRVFNERVYPAGEAVAPVNVLNQVINRVVRLYRGGSTVVSGAESGYAAGVAREYPAYSLGDSPRVFNERVYPAGVRTRPASLLNLVINRVAQFYRTKNTGANRTENISGAKETSFYPRNNRYGDQILVFNEGASVQNGENAPANLLNNIFRSVVNLFGPIAEKVIKSANTTLSSQRYGFSGRGATGSPTAVNNVLYPFFYRKYYRQYRSGTAGNVFLKNENRPDYGSRLFVFPAAAPAAAQVVDMAPAYRPQLQSYAYNNGQAAPVWTAGDRSGVVSRNVYINRRQRINALEFYNIKRQYDMLEIRRRVRRMPEVTEVFRDRRALTRERRLPGTPPVRLEYKKTQPAANEESPVKTKPQAVGKPVNAVINIDKTAAKPGQPAKIDINSITREVYLEIEKRLKLERQRRGL